MKHKTADLEGALLDAAVAKAEGDTWSTPSAYSRLWEFGGAIIERERISLVADETDWIATLDDQEIEQCGPTALIASMRTYVASKFGEEVEL